MSEESRGGVLGNNTTDILDQEQDREEEMRPNHNHNSRRYENHNYRNTVSERPVKKILKKKKKSNAGKICSFTGVILVILIIGAFILVKFQKEIETTGLFNFIPSKPLETRIPQTENRNDQDSKLKTNEIDNSETNHVQVDNEKDTIETTIPVEQIHNQPKQSVPTDLLSSPDTPKDPPAQLRNFEISSTSGAQDVEKTSAINKEPEKEVVQVKLPDNPTTKHLFEAIKDDNVPLASALINNDVDLKEFNDEGYNTLHYAASLMNVQIMKLIIARESKNTEFIDLKTTDKDTLTALHVVATKAGEYPDTALQAARILLDSGAEIEAKARLDFTPLFCAVVNSRHFPMVQFLLDSGADINAVLEKSKHTPLHRAMYSCEESIIKLLIHRGAKQDSLNSFLRRPIHEAAFAGCVAGIGQLIASDPVNKNIKTPPIKQISDLEDSYIYYGATPLHFAIIEGKFEAVQELFRYFALPTIYDDSNKTALNYAEENEDDLMVELIKNTISRREYQRN